MVANNNSIPPQGTPGVADARNPTLLPNFDTSTVPTLAKNGGVPTVNHSSAKDFLTANPRVDATCTATLGGSATAADEVTIDLANPALAAQGVTKISHTYVVVSGDTLQSIAEGLATLFNDDAIAQAADIRVDASEDVLTFRQAGPVGNFSTLSSPVAEGAVITCGGTSLTGDQINVLFTGPGLGAGVTIQTTPTTLDSANTMGVALASAINGNGTLSGLGFVATNTSGAVKITGVPAGDYQIASWVNKTAPTVVVGGTPDAADVLTLTITAANLPGSPHSVAYTTLLTDTTTALAAQGLTNAINADPVLAAAGITASLSSSTISITVPVGFGQVRYTESTSGTLSLTAPSDPTTTAAKTDSESETVTFGNGGVFANGSGPILVTNNFTFTMGSNVQAFWYGKPYLLGYDVVTAMVQQGMPII